MTLNELRNYMENEVALNDSLIINDSKVLLRYIPAVVAEHQGLKEDGYYFELRSIDHEALNQLTEQNFKLEIDGVSQETSLVFIENYGGGLANRAILCFYSSINVSETFKLHFISGSVPSTVDFHVDKIVSANNIKLTL